MTREPSGLEGLRTLRLREIANRAAASRFSLLLLALALLAGIGLGNWIGSTAHAEDGQDARTESVLAASVPVGVPNNDSDASAGGTDSVPSQSSTDYELAATGLKRLELEDLRESDEPHGEAASRYAAISIDRLPIHRSDPLEDESDSLTLVTRGEIAAGESLGSSLRRQGISASTVHLVATEMRKVFDFRKSRPGDAYRLGQDESGRVLDFRYSQDPEESYSLTWDGARYVVQKESAPLHAQIAKIAGVVDSSFYGAIVGLGEQSALASEFVQIFAWDIDFSRNVHPGDEFSILYERLYRRNDDGEEVYVRPGRILAGRYAGKSGPHTVVYYEDDETGGAYFRPDGSSVERAFLAAPLEFSRISSRFTRARHHPILNVTRPHPGIDYAAPYGTPVYAVAEGVIEYKSRAGASGNLVRIRHSGGYTSHYAHLSRFEAKLGVGDHVEQRQVIGYVGSSGLSTGPHVCFRVKKDGRYVDPMKISSPAGSPVDRDQLAEFASVRDQLLASLGPAPMNLADEAL